MDLRASASPDIAGVLLAAGMSTRMGRNKLFLPLDGETVLARAVSVALSAGLDPLLVVVGHEAERVRDALSGARARFVFNRHYAQGLPTSLRAGIAAVPDTASAAVVLLADMPLVDAAMIQALVARWRGSGAPLAVSRYGGVVAPPIVYGAALFTELRALDGDGCGKQVIKHHRGEEVAVDWPVERLTDLDVPADLERVAAREAVPVRADLLRLAVELSARGEPLVLAVVVRREPYSSAQPGDLAIVTASGAFHGWVGGACAAPSVRREAARVMLDGQPRLVSLSPDPAQAARPGMVALPMSCHSGGTVEIFLEPVLPAPRLRVYGSSPTARSLVAIGKAMGHVTELVAPGLDEAAARALGAERWIGDVADEAARAGCRAPLHAVVATMGEFDEDAIAAAIAAQPQYLGVVASRRRFAELRAALIDRGVPVASLDAIHNPAGLHLGAHRPEEVAISVLAEIVQLAPAEARREQPAAADVAPTAVDPICGMAVDIAIARHVAERDGVTYYFCCAGCRERFLAPVASPRRIALTQVHE